MNYEVWLTQGLGGVCIAKFDHVDDAEDFLNICVAKGDGSYAIFPAETQNFN